MAQMFFKTKKATVLAELLIVVSITIFMSVVLFLISDDKNAALEVDIAAEQIVAELHGLQNDALNGRQIDGVETCLFKFGSDTVDTYAVSYYDCAAPENLIKKMSPVKLKNVTITVSALGSVLLSTPLGKSNSTVDIVITSVDDISMKKMVSVGGDGAIIISKI